MEETLKKTLILFQKQISFFKKIIERKNIDYSLKINDNWYIKIDYIIFLKQPFRPTFLKPLFCGRSLFFPQLVSTSNNTEYSLFTYQNQIYNIDWISGYNLQTIIKLADQNNKLEDYDFLNIYPLIKEGNMNYPLFKKFQKTNAYSYMFKSITKSDLKNILILLTCYPPLKDFDIYF